MKSLPNDDNTRPVNDVILRTTCIDNDVITEFNSDGSEGASITQIVISESYKLVFSQLKKSTVSVDSCDNDNGSRPKSSGSSPIIIVIPKSSLTSTPEEKVNPSTTPTDVYENNEIHINNIFLEFVNSYA